MHMLIAMAAVTVLTSIVLPCLLFGGASLCPALEAGCCLAIITRRLPCTILLVTIPSLHLAFYCLLGELGNVAHGRGRSSMPSGGLFYAGMFTHVHVWPHACFVLASPSTEGASWPPTPNYIYCHSLLYWCSLFHCLGQTYCCCRVALYMYVLLEAHVWREVSFGSGVGSHSSCLWSGCV